MSGRICMILVLTLLLCRCQGDRSGTELSSELASGSRPVLTAREKLGRFLFFDENLSVPPGQSCMACHGMGVGFTGPVSFTNAHTAVYEGALQGRFGNRKPPSAAYASFSPEFHYDKDEEVYVGGQFWDGRASDLAEQARGPFLNPLEHNNPDAEYICKQVSDSKYADLFEEVYGRGSLGFSNEDETERTYQLIVEAIAAYEASFEVNQFSSKYDYYLAGNVELTPREALGLELFEDEKKGNCAACHPSQPDEEGNPPLFTDFTYDNLGIPANPENPFYSMVEEFNSDGADWVDLGLGAIVGLDSEMGKMKVPTLRNVDKRPHSGFIKSFGHNGFFKSLEDITHFYNVRDVENWPPPEVPENMNTDELGDLGLTADEEAAIVAFMKTLSDGYVPPE